MSDTTFASIKVFKKGLSNVTDVSVIVKVHDCRIYHACGSDQIVREYMEKEANWDDLINKDLEISQIVAPEQVEPHLKVTFQENDYVKFNKP